VYKSRCTIEILSLVVTLSTLVLLAFSQRGSIEAQVSIGEIQIEPHRDNFPFTDAQFLEEIQQRAFNYFWHEANPKTGLVKDRAINFGEDDYHVASIAATGFGLAALAVGEKHGWVEREGALERALTTLRFFRDEMENHHGFYYHFVDVNTGERVWKAEVSSIDTALFLAGALFIGEYFKGTEVETLAHELYRRVDFQWLLTDDGARPDEKRLSHGWKPETGFLSHRWDSYSELMILYQLAIGSPTYPIPASSWEAWERPMDSYAGYVTFAIGPLFTHQFSHIFIDFQNKRDRLGYDYWMSSVNASKANRQFCIDNVENFKTYGENVWGLTASDGPTGYEAYGAPPGYIRHDGTVSPGAPAASIVFTPELSLSALKYMYQKYSKKIWGRYGFSNAFNLDENWFDRDVIGIDLGATLLMIENYRSGLIWEHFMPLESIRVAMDQAGFETHKAVELSTDFKEKLLSLRWVAYSPTNFNPLRSVFPDKETIKTDLKLLKEVGFGGIVTYGNNSIIPQVAKELGLYMLYGVWNPLDEAELRRAKESAQNDSVLGFVVGNEGLNSRYSYSDLINAISDLQAATGKPATTTEELGDYNDAKLLEVGTWVFINAHPYWAGITDPKQAVEWTQEQFAKITARTDKIVLFKEVGLPTAGDDRVNEQKQAEYYRRLGQTDVKFVWFEAYDQFWKTHAPVEPFWGLFRKDRSPKLVVSSLSTQEQAAFPHRALWVWDATVITDPRAQANFFTCLGEKQIDLIFLEVGDAFIGKNAPPSKVQVSKEVLAGFVSKAHVKGIAVYALDGDASWAKEENHQIPLERLQHALDFNNAVEPKARLDGFQFDIEPYLLPEFKTEEWENVLKAYLSLAGQLRDKVVGTSFSLGFAIPFWWDVQDLAISEVEKNGVKKPVAYHLIDLLNPLPKSHIALMAYRDQATGEDGSIRHASDEINYVNNFAPKVTVFVGQETADVKGEPEKITFYQEGEAALEEAIAQLVEAFKEKKGFGGVAIHYYKSYRELTQKAVTPTSTVTGSDQRFEIVSPMKGKAVERITMVQGTAAYAEGRYVELWVYPYNDQWYLQNGQASVSKTGEWKLTCYFGNEHTPKGYKFKIKAELKEADGALVGTTLLDYVQR
jgi:exo-beta-1,3-glucanase (GH17 family)